MLRHNSGISVLVRTRDVENLFPKLLQRLSRQKLQPSEIVVVDNFSSAENLEAMRSILVSVKGGLFNGQVSIRLVPVKDSEFSHPYSTNVGVYAAKGDLVCITNGHSLPSSDGWLEAGVQHFVDSGVAGVGGYMVPHENGTIWEKIGYDWLWKRRNEVSKAHSKDDFFSTVNCIIRRSLWEKYPFDEGLPSLIPYSGKFGGEDYDWAMEMEARGHKIVVEPKFVVRHSHRETLAQLTSKYIIWRRIRNEIRSLKRPRKSYTKLEGIEPSYYDL